MKPCISKPPAQTTKLKALQKLILSYFFNLLHLIDQLSDHDTTLLAVNESAKIAPYIVTSRKAVKAYIKVTRANTIGRAALTHRFLISSDLFKTVVISG